MKRLLCLLVLALALVACGPRAEPAAAPLDAGDAVGTEGTARSAIAAESRLLDSTSGKLAPGDIAPDFSYTLPDGAQQRLSELKGTAVVINFWATWCLPCIEEMPELQSAYVAGEGKLVILAVNRNELPEAIARFAPKVDVAFPLIANTDGAIGDRYGVTSLPTTYFINSDGTIGAIQIGALTPSVLAERLKALQ